MSNEDRILKEVLDMKSRLRHIEDDLRKIKAALHIDDKPSSPIPRSSSR